MINFLKCIRQFLRKRKIKFGLVINKSLNNIYPLHYFKKRLILEKRRAERFNTGATIIIYNLDRHFGTARSFKTIIEFLLKTIGSTIRETDVISYDNKNMILILLPDTDLTGAHLVYNKLIQQFKKLQTDNTLIKNINFTEIEFDIVLFPEKLILQQPSGRSSPEKETKGSSPMLNDAHNSIPLKILPLPGFSDNLQPNSFALTEGIAIAIPFMNDYSWFLHVLSLFFWRLQHSIKRGIDIIGSILGLVIFAPLMLITSLMIKLTSPGPILFKQKRLGYKGNCFTFLKFRSMYLNCETRLHQDYVKKFIKGKNDIINNGTADKPFFKIKNDPRITPSGHFLRKTSIDELPQLWNVLKGEMSLVGPRPPIFYEVEDYQPWHLRRIFEAKPGITGLWQVSGRNKMTFDDMVRLDIQYAKNWSLLLDLKIIGKTIKTLFITDGE